MCVLGGADITNVSGPPTCNSHTPPTNPIDCKRQLDRDRYAQMSPLSKDELLKRRTEYREQMKVSLSSEDIECVHAKDRARYASMSPNKKHEKINRGSVLRALRRNTPSQCSIAMENPLHNTVDVVLPLRGSVSIGPCGSSSISCDTDIMDPKAQTTGISDGNFLYFYLTHFEFPTYMYHC